jgi:hypothetical protein
MSMMQQQAATDKAGPWRRPFRRYPHLSGELLDMARHFRLKEDLERERSLLIFMRDWHFCQSPGSRNTT